MSAQILKQDIIDKLNRAFPLAARIELGTILDGTLVGMFEKNFPNKKLIEPGLTRKDVQTGDVDYKGTWNASTNIPQLADNGIGGVKGDYYVVSVTGTTNIDGENDWNPKDWIISNGTTWDKVDNSETGTGTLSNIVEDTTPQLGGQLDVNGFSLGDGILELLKFIEIINAVNEITVKNNSTGNDPEIIVSGDDVNIGLNLVSKGSGLIKYNGVDLVNLSKTQSLVNKTINGSNNTIIINFEDIIAKVGGASLTAGNGAGDNMTLISTSNATKGKIVFGNSFYNEAINELIIGTGTKHDGFITKPSIEITTVGNVQTTLDFITLEDENTYHVEARVIGVESDGTNRASYHIAATVYRTVAGVATLQGSVTSLHTQESFPPWSATFTVSGNDIRVSVTGWTATTIEWGCVLFYTNMSN